VTQDEVSVAEDDVSVDGVDGLDFFISYTGIDREWAEWIAWELRADGYEVRLQAWHFVPGSNWAHQMQEALTTARRVVVVLSEAFLRSAYGLAELLQAFSTDPLGKQRRLLLFRIEACARPGLLRNITSVDLFDCSESVARGRLLAAVATARRGHAVPRSQPPFPGSPRSAPGSPRSAPGPPRFPGDRLQVWQVPRGPAHFTGRERELKQLEAGFEKGSGVTVQTLLGTAGIGKTCLAGQFARRNAEAYDAVWWFTPDSTLREQFALLATHLGTPPESDETTVRQKVLEALRDVRGWLLVFDDPAEDPGEVEKWLPELSPRPGYRRHVLVTTARRAFDFGRVIEVDRMETAEAVALLRTRVPDGDPEALTKIAEELGQLPLALEQAAAYLGRTRMPPQRYLGAWRNRTAGAPWKQYQSGPDKHHEMISALWEFTIRRIRKESPAAVQLLDMCAYLAPEPIPLELFAAHPDRLPLPLSTVAQDPIEFDEMVAVPLDYSLIKRNDDTIQMHPLVQDAIRSRHARRVGPPDAR
jgi:hypothetical protein